MYIPISLKLVFVSSVMAKYVVAIDSAPNRRLGSTGYVPVPVVETPIPTNKPTKKPTTKKPTKKPSPAPTFYYPTLNPTVSPVVKGEDREQFYVHFSVM